VYACLSPRTDQSLLVEAAGLLGYAPVAFRAADVTGRAVYHTNVILAVSAGVVVVCAEAIEDADRDRVLASLGTAGGAPRPVVRITHDQTEAFAGNVLCLRGSAGPVTVLSTTALNSLRPDQREALCAHGSLLAVRVPTIQTFGGGGVRCMIAEVFLNAKA
jgi:hypothetical protein